MMKMIVKKTDSLGLEILNSIVQDEIGNAIKPVKTKEEAINDKSSSFILFEIYEEGKIIEYFTLSEEVYYKWVKEYKLEGIEI